MLRAVWQIVRCFRLYSKGVRLSYAYQLYMKQRFLHLMALALALAVPACTATQPYIAPSGGGADASSTADPAYRVFLIGDAGELEPDEPAPALRLLRAQLATAGEDAAVVFLGDNLYGGLADSGSVRRAAQEARLHRLLATVEGCPGRVVFEPREKEWV